MNARAVLLPLLCLTACATAPEVQGPPPTPPEERSSLDVVLRHRDELQLTAQQLDTIELADSQRETMARTVRDQFAAQSSAPKEDTFAATTAAAMGFGANAGGQNQAAPPASGLPPQMTAGPTPLTGPGTRRARGPSEQERLDARLDELDTLSFLEVSERVLTNEQRPMAEKLATAYRTRLFEYRQAMKRRKR